MRSQRRKYALNFRRKLYVTYIYVILCYITLDHIIILLMLHICYMLHCVMSCYYHESEFWLWYTVYIHVYTFSISRYICVRIIYIHTYIHVFLWHLRSSWHPGLTYLHLYPQVGRWMICSRARTSIGFPIWWVPFLSIFLDFKSSSIPSRKTYDISILMQWCLDDQNMLGWL